MDVNPLTGPTMCQVADTLDAAADYIEEHGWIQGNTRDGHGSVCALGAIRGALGGYGTDLGTIAGVTSWMFELGTPQGDLERMTCDVLEYHINQSTRFTEIASWNDYKGRKGPATVVETMRRVARIERAEEGC